MAAPATTPDSLDGFDVTAARTVIQWSKPDGQTCFLSLIDSESAEAGQITFDCHFRPASSTVSVRLRAPMLLKGLGRKIIPFFVFIAPERIQSLAYEDASDSDLPGNVKLGGDGDMLALRFKLSRPADLVVPSQTSLIPKKNVFRDVFDSLKMLSQELDFVVYLRQDVLPSRDCLASCCKAVTAGTLATSIADADIARLYDGKGGKILGVGDLAVPATAPVDSPPSYDHVGPPPPAPPIENENKVSVAEDPASTSSRKRRRTSSSPSCAATDSGTKAQSHDNDRVEAICRQLMGEMSAKWREDSDQLRIKLEQMETRVKDWVDERLNKHVDDLRRELQNASVQQRNLLHEEVHEVRREVQETYDRVEEVHEDLQVLKDETSEAVDARLDDRIDTVRGELEEFVTEKMHEAQDRIVDHIRSNVYIDFNIYD